MVETLFLSIPNPSFSVDFGKRFFLISLQIRLIQKPITRNLSYKPLEL